MYIVIELQNNNGQVSNIVTAFNTQQQAEQKFHEIMMYAATTALTSHSAVILNDRGEMIRAESYPLLP